MSTLQVTKPIKQILSEASMELGIMEEDLKDTRSGVRATEGRYMIFALMEKAGHSQGAISREFQISRAKVNIGLAKLDTWLKAYKSLAGTYMRLERIVLP